MLKLKVNIHKYIVHVLVVMLGVHITTVIKELRQIIIICKVLNKLSEVFYTTILVEG